MTGIERSSPEPRSPRGVCGQSARQISVESRRLGDGSFGAAGGDALEEVTRLLAARSSVGIRSATWTSSGREILPACRVAPPWPLGSSACSSFFMVAVGPVMMFLINRDMPWAISRQLQRGRTPITTRTRYAGGAWNPARPLGPGNYRVRPGVRTDRLPEPRPGRHPGGTDRMGHRLAWIDAHVSRGALASAKCPRRRSRPRT